MSLPPYLVTRLWHFILVNFSSIMYIPHRRRLTHAVKVSTTSICFCKALGHLLKKKKKNMITEIVTIVTTTNHF